jgi:hypothetical protein
MHLRLFASLWLAILALGCGPELYVMTEDHDRVDGGPWVYTGGGCSAIGGGSSSGTGIGTEGSSYSLEVNDDGAFFQLIENGKVTKEKRYDRAFIESGKKGRISFDVAWRTHRITLWGGPECIEPKMPDDEEIDKVLTPPTDLDAGVAADAER